MATKTPTIQETTAHQIDLLNKSWDKVGIKYPSIEEVIDFIQKNGKRMSSFSVECWVTIRWEKFAAHEREKMLTDGLGMGE